MVDFGREIRLVASLAIALFIISNILTMIGGFTLPQALLWNSVSTVHLDFDYVPFSAVTNPYTVVADIIDALVFTLMAFALATVTYEFIRKLRIEDRINYTKIKRLNKHVILAPLNQFSEALAEELEREHVPCVVIRAPDSEHIHAHRKGVITVLGETRSIGTFTALGIERAQSVVACSDDDIENAMIILTAKSARAGIKIISRSSSVESIPRLSKAGAIKIIMPEVSAGTRMGEDMITKIYGD